MASINDLATAATIASSAVALQSSPKDQPTRPSSPPSPPPQEDPLSPPSPSPSAQLQLQAQEAHAQRIVSASRSPAPEAPEAPEPDPAPSTPPGAATATSSSSAPDSTSIVVNAGGVVTAATPHTPTPTPTPGPVLAAPLISQNPAQATIPPQASPEMTPGNGEGSREREDRMDGVEYDSETRKPPVRGAFIVFEGMDRAGKTTQAKLLQLRCIESGREVKFMRFPDRATPIGQMIDAYLKGEAEIEDHVIHLLFSANRWEAAQKIKAELEAGHTIICDRFYHSGIVYSAAKQQPSLSLSWAKAPEIGLPRPDMVLFLDLEESVARSRGGWGGEVYEKGEMQRRVRELFWGLSMGDLGNAVSVSKAAASNGKGPSRSERVPFGNGTNSSNARDREGRDTEAEGEFRQEEEDIQIVDADVGVEELAEKVWDIVRGRIEAVERGEEGRTVRTVR
ncbi:thymidylate kinase-domain-containing protein [Xylaria sp. FL1042]|nr:thymidylate kinase-domain-containing protein [Xylaria sp. FL1042]